MVVKFGEALVTAKMGFLEKNGKRMHQSTSEFAAQKGRYERLLFPTEWSAMTITPSATASLSN